MAALLLNVRQTKKGAQNLIEPASIGVPVLLRPSTYNFAEASQLALAAGAARQVTDAGALVALALQLLASQLDP